MRRTCVDNSVLGNYTVLRGIGVHNLELNCPHTTTDEESVVLPYGTVR